MANVIVLPGIDDAGIARWLHRRLAAALAETPDELAITVPGGATPFPILAELAGMELDWGRLAVWPGDDRLVPEDHPASNVGRVRELFESRGARVVALAEAAAPPHFALAWLGMGADGHVASLFPNTDPQPDDPLRVRRITPDPLPPDAPFDRVTLTIPALTDSDEIVFVIRGDQKRALFEQAMARGNDLPVARLLGAARQPVTCFA
jgi:6-phosphogluconolactonase